jgi:hypothetical protein
VQIEDFRKNLLGRSYQYTDMQKYNALYYVKPKEIINSVEMTPNKIIAGFSTLDYKRENLVIIDIGKFTKGGRPRAVQMLVIGPNGTGKSALAGNLIFTNFVGRLGESAFIYDPKDEWDNHTQPAYASKRETKQRVLIDRLLDEIGEVEGKKLERRGYECIKICPIVADAGTAKNVKYFSVCYSDLMLIKKRTAPEAPKLFIELIGFDIGQHEYGLDLIKLIMNDEDVTTFKEFYEEVQKTGIREGYSEKTILVLRRKLKAAMESNYITDDPEKSINILELMRNYNAVIFKGLLKSSQKLSPVEACFYATLKIELWLIYIDCYAYHVQRDETAIIKNKNGILFACDELPVICNENENTTTRDFIANFLLQGRAAGIDFLGIAQESSLIYNELKSQIKITFTTRLTPSNIKYLEGKGVGPEWLSVKEGGLLTTLKINVEPIICGEPSGLDVAQQAFINENGRVTRCYPFVPLSKIHERGK